MSAERPDSEIPVEPKRTRLGALKTLGVAIVGVAAGTAFTKERTASAATGTDLVLGTANTAEDQTKLTMDGTLPANTSAFVVAAANANAAIEGNSSSIGVLGNATTGVMGVGDIGGVFAGDANAIMLRPQSFAGESIPSTDDHLTGDLLVDANGVLWLCVADGTPGAWIRVSHGGMRLLPSPQRAYDSRAGNGARVNQGETVTIPIAGVVPGVPLNALGVIANLTVDRTLGGGFLTAYPAGTPVPTTSNVNWNTNDQTIANGATIGLGGGGISLFADASVPAGTPATHVIVDVAGYVR
jgi:hypothetical protein